MDFDAPTAADLVTFEDDREFSELLGFLEGVSPSTVVVPRDQQDGACFSRVAERWGGSPLVALPKRAFDVGAARARAAELCVGGEGAEAVARGSDALPCLGALLGYAGEKLRVDFEAGSLRIRVRALEGALTVDGAAAAHLELLRNARTGGEAGSLFGAVNATLTRGGRRLLRAALQSPLCHEPTLAARLDCVGALVGCADGAQAEVRALLAGVPDLDAALAVFATRARGPPTGASCRALASAVVAIKHALPLLPRVAAALRAAAVDDALLAALAGALEDDRLAERLPAHVDAVVDGDTALAKGALEAATQETYMVRGGVDGQLDAARQCYSEGVQRLHDLAAAAREGWRLPALKLAYSAARGYHFSAPTAALPGGKPPPGAEQVAAAGSGGATTVFTTAEATAANARVGAAQAACIALTAGALAALCARVRRSYLPALYRAAEALALLDMLSGFAALVLRAPPGAWCRPALVGGGAATALRRARHPVVEAALLAGGAGRAPYVAHSLSLGGAGEPALLLLGGGNGSGKSTLLRTVGVATVLAHIGCWVPAEAASIRLTTRVCARMGMGDDAESNASTFLLEMRETAWLLEQAQAPGAAPLVLIDELGRGTSRADGAALAWAVAEELALRTPAQTLFASHFHELATLGRLYPEEVALAHLGGSVGGGGGGEEEGEGGRDGFSLTAGALGHPGDALGGLRVVASLGLPAAFVADAERIRALLAAGRAEAEGAAARSLAAAAGDGDGAAAAAMRELRGIAAALRDATAAGGGGGGPSEDEVAAWIQRVRDGYCHCAGGADWGSSGAAAPAAASKVGSPGDTQPAAAAGPPETAGGAAAVPGALCTWDGGEEELCA